MKTLYILLLLVFISRSVVGQTVDTMKVYELKQAILAFENSKYEEAYPYFEKMLKKFSKEPLYNYYAGICLYHLHPEPEKSLDVLRYAATQDVPDDIYFYLGCAYHKNYQFEYAQKFFQRFERNIEKEQQHEHDVVNYISRSQNALYLLNSFDQPEVYKVDVADEHRFHNSIDLTGLEGQFVTDPVFFRKDSVNQRTLVFFPNDIEWGEVLYFSMVNPERGDKDIYRITKINEEEWGVPENLGDVINTPFEEENPFLHFDGTTLYFASEGHYSMGGLDLYKSTWDWETQSWSDPINLGFPINSPFDDLLYVETPDRKISQLVSKRDSEEEVSIYKLGNKPYQHYEKIRDEELLKQIAKLEVNVVLEEEGDKGKKKKDQEIYKHHVTTSEGFKNKNEYDSLLNVAMKNQLKADSVRWVIEDERKKYDNTQDVILQREIARKILSLEQEVYVLQKKTDKAYEQVKLIEQTNLEGNKNLYAEVEVEVETGKEKDPDEKKPIVNESIEAVQTKANLTEVDSIYDEAKIEIVEFELKDKPWYSRANPVPIDEKLPDGVVYRVQLGIFSKPVNPVAFKGMYPISGIKTSGGKYKKYFAGLFYWYASAQKQLPVIRKQGFKDAFIVAYKDGEVVKEEEAKRYERRKGEFKVAKEGEEEIEVTKSNEIRYQIFVQIPNSDAKSIERFDNYTFGNYKVSIDEGEDFKSYVITGFVGFEAAYAEKASIQDCIPYEAEIHAFFSNSKIPIETLRE